MATLPIRDSSLSSMSSLPIRQRARPPVPTQAPPPAFPPISLTNDTHFNLLYAGNETALRHFLGTRTLLPRNLLNNMFEFIKAQKEPGIQYPYHILPISLSAMRNFLIASPPGKQLLVYYRTLLKVQGCYIVTTAEEVAFDTLVKMVRALFIEQNDKQLRDHIITIVPNAQYFMRPYSKNDRQFFDMYVFGMKAQLRDACAAATTELINMKNSEEFAKKHKQLLKANEAHEAKLSELRSRDAKRRAEREGRLQRSRGSNDLGRRRQMGMQGLTSHTPGVEQSVIEYVQETTSDFFPHTGDDQVNSEEQLLESLGLSY